MSSDRLTEYQYNELLLTVDRINACTIISLVAVCRLVTINIA